ncbi:MAG: MFS transporter [Oscillospiraceae bacterium]|nr:MFS transporter [Oscillospiraceae bacterium]
MASKEKKAQTTTAGRTYVGSREVAGYVMFDMTARMPVRTNEEWVDRILYIDRGVQALVGPIKTVWDIINDLFLAALVEKTRTRYGKFRPYLVFYPIYGLPVSLLLYMLPFFFWGTDGFDLFKIIAWLAVDMFNEMTGTLADICRTGVTANITPNPQERLSLITKGNLYGQGTNLPGQIFGVLRDIISRSKKYTAVEKNLKMRSLFAGFGIGTLILCGCMSLYFAFVNRERVFGENAAKDETPTIRESMRAIISNRPLFMIMLAEILEAFNIKSQLGIYTNSVLNFSNFGLVSGIPGGFISTPSYFYVVRLRKRFSTKALWIASENISKPIIVAAYFFGMIKTKKSVNGINRMFMQLWPMLAIYCLEDMVSMTLYGCKRVITAELRNECIDYGEWKTGMRSEAMVGVIRQVPKKVAGIFGNAMNSVILKLLGFKGGEAYLDNSEKTAIGIFTMSTIVPTLTGIINLIPKFFFNITQKDREIMYKELPERRARAVALLNAAYAESMQEESASSN